MTDIQTRHDLEKLLREFYGKLLQDPAISYIFIDVAKINLEEHLPYLVDFWEQTLFHTGGYRKNVMQLHLDLNAKEAITEKHFEIWLATFNAAVDSLFVGENAENAKTRALSIATVMKIKLA
jgi:hemoglobin